MANEVDQSMRCISISSSCQAIEAMEHGSPLGITMITHFKAKDLKESKGEPPAKMAKVSKKKVTVHMAA